MEFFIFMFGLIIGSFLNVCIYRLPREMSIIRPPSACPQCKNQVKPWDNIPLISYIMLKGKCRYCGERISIRYPMVELLNGIFYLLIFYSFGLGWHLLPLCAFVSAMIVITFIDLEFQIIPDVITLPGIAVGVISSSLLLPDPLFNINQSGILAGFLNSLSGLLLGGGLFFLIALLSRGGMGGGDIKMMAMVGAFIGWKGVLLVTFIGSLTGSIVGIFLMLLKGKDRKTKVPFGPFLALGSVITLFFGGKIISWYLG